MKSRPVRNVGKTLLSEENRCKRKLRTACQRMNSKVAGPAVYKNVAEFNEIEIHTEWMVYSLVVREHGLEYMGREFESRSLHLKPETKLREERELCYGQKLPQT